MKTKSHEKTHDILISLLENDRVNDLYEALRQSRIANAFIWGPKTELYISSLYLVPISLCAILLRDWNFRD